MNRRLDQRRLSTESWEIAGFEPLVAYDVGGNWNGFAQPYVTLDVLLTIVERDDAMADHLRASPPEEGGRYFDRADDGSVRFRAHSGDEWTEITPSGLRDDAGAPLYWLGGLGHCFEWADDGDDR